MRERRFKKFQEKKEKASRRAYTLFSQDTRKVNNTFLKQVLTSYKTARRWKPAYQMFQNLVQHKVHPDRDNFRRFLVVVGDRGGQLKNAFAIFRYSGRIIKDISAYNVMLLALSRHQFQMNDDVVEDHLPTNSLKKALELYDEIKQQNNVIQPNMFTYLYLFKNCEVELKRIKAAAAAAAVQSSSSSTSSTLIYTREQVMEKAAFIADEMMQSDVTMIRDHRIKTAFRSVKLRVSDYKKKYSAAIEEKKRIDVAYDLWKQQKQIQRDLEHEKIEKEAAEAQLTIITRKLKELGVDL